jgi:hypothetical protein
VQESLQTGLVDLFLCPGTAVRNCTELPLGAHLISEELPRKRRAH